MPDAAAAPLTVTDLGALIFESSNDCVKMLDTDGLLLSMNKNGQCLMEIDDFSAVAGCEWSTMWPPEANAAILHALREARAGRTGHFEAFCPTAKATPKWWDVIVTPMLDSAGGIQRILSISRDVTESRRASDELRASRARFSLLLESSGEGIYGIGPDHACMFINRTGARMLGYEPRELIGRQLHSVLHHRRADGAPSPWEDSRLGRAAAAGVAVRAEDDVFWHKDGRAIPVSYSVAPMVGEHGAEGAVVTFADITERKQAEQALFESRQSLEKIISQAATGVVQTDAVGRATLVNQKFCDMVGYTQTELLGMSVMDLTAPGSVVATRRAVASLALGGPPVVVEKQYLRKDGELIWATSSVNALRTLDGAFQGMVAIVADLTERKLAEEKLREADRRKDEFLAMLAHELRNPLAPIGAAAELLKLSKSNPDQVRRTSEIISRQVAHMTNLVDDLLDVSRVTRGLVTLDKVALDMRHIVTDAVEQVSPLIERKRHRLALHLAPGVASVMGDNKRLVQIVANLLNNAAKYTPAGGALELRTEVDADMVCLTVSDNGIGIERQLADRVFDLFTQAEHTPDRSSGGLGLGLALVKNLVELHGGSVSCFSAGAGQGSSFRVALPRLTGEVSASAARERAEQGARATIPRRILLVDDNVDAAMMLGMLLEASGHQLTVIHSAPRALELIEQQQFDVCLLDIGLPEMDGNELARRVRAHPRGRACTLIAITGYGQDSDRQNTTEAGFDHHMIKPVDTSKLLDVLARTA